LTIHIKASKEWEGALKRRWFDCWHTCAEGNLSDPVTLPRRFSLWRDTERGTWVFGVGKWGQTIFEVKHCPFCGIDVEAEWQAKCVEEVP